MFMVIGKTLIKDHTRPGVSLEDVFSEVNDLLCDSNQEGMFITAFEGVFDLVSGEFCFVNAGHEVPFISGAGEPFEPYKIQPGVVLAGMENMKYQCGSIRLGDVLKKNTEKSPEELLSVVREDIDAFMACPLCLVFFLKRNKIWCNRERQSWKYY